MVPDQGWDVDDYSFLPRLDLADRGGALEDRWTDHYFDSVQCERDLRAWSVGAFTWMWDVTGSSDLALPADRIIGVYGYSSPPTGERDASRIAGFPSPRTDGHDRDNKGHAAAHSIGGPDEGYNLFGQDPAVNLGRKWREMERSSGRQAGLVVGGVGSRPRRPVSGAATPAGPRTTGPAAARRPATPR